jgi:hypothetical protein
MICNGEDDNNIVRNLFGQPLPDAEPPLNLSPDSFNQLNKAREQYWAAYEKGDPAELLAARIRFSNLLFLRDLLAL